MVHLTLFSVAMATNFNVVEMSFCSLEKLMKVYTKFVNNTGVAVMSKPKTGP